MRNGPKLTGRPDPLLSPKRSFAQTDAYRSRSFGTRGKSVFLEVPGLVPVMQQKITMNIKAEDGTAMPKEIAHTINVVPPEEKAGVTYSAKR